MAQTPISKLAQLNAELEIDGMTAADKKVKAKQLLKYFRKRQHLYHPSTNHWQPRPAPLSTQEQTMADNGLQRLLFVHKGYGYFDYGQDINWHLWPVKDNEVRYQLHRMYWWLPMAKAYWQSGNEKYAKEWMAQYRDWVNDNPLTHSKVSDDPVKVTADNGYDPRYPWRSLEVSRRLQDQAELFNYFLPSPHFDEDFLVEFLLNYHRHAKRLHHNYSSGKNHLLFQAQRMLMASILFPEFKDSRQWQQKAIAILHTELKKQIQDDGYQYEISPNYHVACIEIFLKAYEVAKINGLGALFNQDYLPTVNKMIHANIAMSYPDLSVPMFGDAKWRSWAYMYPKYQKWAKFFPKDAVLSYYASAFTKGKTPNYLSKALTTTGLYSLRNGWSPNATVLLMRNGIPGGEFHSQPDNGTYELWHNGTNLMPDAGAYIYAGDEEVMKQRRWFRQSKIHNTLTLDDQEITVDAKLLHWQAGKQLDTLVVENKSYPNLSHRRSVFFVEQRFFIILDEAIGKAMGRLNIRHFVKEGNTEFNAETQSLTTLFDGANINITPVAIDPITASKEMSKVSYSYRKASPRAGLNLQLKKGTTTSRAITILTPFDDNAQAVKAELLNFNSSNNKVRFSVKINGQPYHLGYQL